MTRPVRHRAQRRPRPQPKSEAAHIPPAVRTALALLAQGACPDEVATELIEPLLITGAAALRFHRGRHRVVDGWHFLPTRAKYLIAREVLAAGRAEVEAWGYLRVVAKDSARVIARAFVFAHENSSVQALSGSQVRAFGRSHIQAKGDAVVYPYEDSHIEAYEDAVVILPIEARAHLGTVKLYGNARIVTLTNQAPRGSRFQ